MKYFIHGVKLVMLLSITMAVAQQPEYSAWTKNISEGQGADPFGLPDLAHEIQVSGNTIHAIWIADSAYHYRLYYRRSVDNGETWISPRLLARGVYPTFPTSPGSKRMSVDGDLVHVVYIDAAEGSANRNALVYLRSTDGGASFEAPRIIHKVTRLAEQVMVSASGGGVTIAVQDGWYQNETYYFLNSADGGAEFTVSQLDFKREANWSLEDLVRDGNHVYALALQTSWYNGLVFGNLYFLASHDGGATFKATLISMKSTEAHLTYPLQYSDDYSPKIALSGSNVYVAWPALDEDQEYNLLFRRSTDRGETWELIFHLTHESFEGTELPLGGMHAVYAYKNYVHLLAQTNANRIIVFSSSDNGTTFAKHKVLTTAGNPGISAGAWPRGCFDPSDNSGKTFHVFWLPGAYVKTSDGGLTFTRPVTVATNFSWYNGIVSRTRMQAGSNGTVHLAMQGRYVYAHDDIFYHRIDPVPSPEGQAVLKLSYVYPGTRSDNMCVASSDALQLRLGLTVEAWINPEAGSEKSAHIISKQNQTTYPYAPSSYQIATHGNRQVSAGITTTEGVKNIYTDESVPEDAWTHVAMTYANDGTQNNLKVYINGLLVKAETMTGGIALGDGVLVIGTPNIFTYGFNGMIDEVRLWGRALKEAEIQEYMYVSLNGEEEGLVAAYNFNHSTKDITGRGHDGYLMYRETYVDGGIDPPDTDDDGISDLEERGPAGYNIDFDGNNDGIPDWRQNHVASFRSYRQQRYLTLATEAPATKSPIPLIGVQVVGLPENLPTGYEFPYDLFGFSVGLPQGVTAVEVKLHPHGDDPLNAYMNFGRLTGQNEDLWYDFGPTEATGASYSDGVFSLRFADGQRGDHDLAANATIVTLGGPAFSSVVGTGPETSPGLAPGLYPNPANHSLEIVYTMERPGLVSLALYALDGKKLAVIYEGESSAGRNHHFFDTSMLAPGVYACILATDGFHGMQKLVVLR